MSVFDNYKKKPVIIQAVQLTPEIFWKIVIDKHHIEGLQISSATYHEKDRRISNVVFATETLEGYMNGSLYDYFIIGVKGETYFCKPDIFEMTYEQVQP